LRKEPNWKPESLAVCDIRQLSKLQNRVLGTSASQISKMRKQLQDGTEFTPIKVAKIGKRLCVVSGFHRLTAHVHEGRTEINALTARMSLPEAEEYALLENTDHGKALSNADKDAMLRRFVEQGRHLWREGEGSYTNYAGTAKNSRQIAKDLNQAIAHTTVRNKFKKWGLEIPKEAEYPHGHKPQETWGLSHEETIAEATESLWHFESLYQDLDDGDDQAALLQTARAIVEALENSERPVRPVADTADDVVMDI
jgi:uncharacterized ParB-like nuclease family protein